MNRKAWKTPACWTTTGKSISLHQVKTMKPQIKDQVALVTGANSGMGLATVQALLEAGEQHAPFLKRDLEARFAERIEEIEEDHGRLRIRKARPDAES